MIGLLLGERYRLVRHIASGGMADVWCARDEVLERTVAAKVMRPAPDGDGRLAARFHDEAVNVAALQHPNVVTLFDYGQDDDGAYLVMELIDGHPLSSLIHQESPLTADRVRAILGQCALALGVAHAAGVVHRDVKPDNILVCHDGLVKLADFGIACPSGSCDGTESNEVLGTPSYLSPEQARGEATTGASDLYALGVVGHEMLTGVKPFLGPTPVTTALSHLHDPPPPLPDDVPADLAGIIDDLLAKSPEDRPADARAVLHRLRSAGHRSMPSRAGSRGCSARRVARRSSPARRT